MILSKEEKLEKYDLSETGLSCHNVKNFPAVNDVLTTAEKFLN